MAHFSISDLFRGLCSENDTEAPLKIFEDQTIGGLKIMMLTPQELTVLCSVNNILLEKGIHTKGFISEPSILPSLLVELKKKFLWNVNTARRLINTGMSSKNFHKIESDKFSAKLGELLNFDGFDDNLALKEIIDSIGLNTFDFFKVLLTTSITTATIAKSEASVFYFCILIFLPLIKFFQKYPAKNIIEHMRNDENRAIEMNRIDFFTKNYKTERKKQTKNYNNPYNKKDLLHSGIMTVMAMLQNPQKKYLGNDIISVCSEYYPHISTKYNNWIKLILRGLTDSKHLEKETTNVNKRGWTYHLDMNKLSIYRDKVNYLARSLDKNKKCKFNADVEAIIEKSLKQLNKLELGMFIIKNGLWDTVPPYYLLQPIVPDAPTFVLVHEGAAPEGYETDPNWLLADCFRFETSAIPNPSEADNIAEKNERSYIIEAEIPDYL